MTALQELRLYQYRNISDQTVGFTSRVNFFFGQNGQGKTNILESIYVLAYTKSFRGTKANELPTFGKKECSIFGVVRSEDHSSEIGVSIQPRSKKVFKDGERLQSLSDYLGTVRCITFTPADMAMLRGSPSLRRRFLDKHCLDLQPSLVVPLLEYQRALKHKSALLRGNVPPRPEEIEPWNEILIRTTVLLLAARTTLVEKLLPVAREQYRNLSSDREEFAISLKNSFLSRYEAPNPELLRRYYSEGMKREIASGKTILGLHHDDLLVSLAGHDARIFASQGQARSVVLALKLGMMSLLKSEGKDSILLLDDVDSELDESRRRHLFKLVFASAAQVFLTGTEARGEFLEVSEGGKPDLFEVAEGRVLSRNIS